ncbi:basic proline-rich protein-like [Pseudopipra pipra]|uniref:basic proline-rich protein-like n=1 Tax=Pseudopipra pipra TaxID=415032 RepID=UPI00313A352D
MEKVKQVSIRHKHGVVNPCFTSQTSSKNSCGRSGGTPALSAARAGAAPSSRGRPGAGSQAPGRPPQRLGCGSGPAQPCPESPAAQAWRSPTDSASGRAGRETPRPAGVRAGLAPTPGLARCSRCPARGHRASLAPPRATPAPRAQTDLPGAPSPGSATGSAPPQPGPAPPASGPPPPHFPRAARLGSGPGPGRAPHGLRHARHPPAPGSAAECTRWKLCRHRLHGAETPGRGPKKGSCLKRMEEGNSQD